MEPKNYKLQVLLDLCGGTESAMSVLLPIYRLKDNGLWLDGQAILDRQALHSDRYSLDGPSADLELIDLLLHRAEAAGLTWHPRMNSSLPALPVPFTSYDLAAFMLAGGGLALFERFNDAPPGPGNVASDAEQNRHAEKERFRLPEQHIERFLSDRGPHSVAPKLGENCGEAREAIDEAIRLRFMADDKFGRSDDGVRESANWLLSELSAEDAAVAARTRPVQRAAAQDAAILNYLRDAGHNPLSLQRNEQGKQGVKAATRTALGNTGMWGGKTVFDKAWERLSRNGYIAYGEE